MKKDISTIIDKLLIVLAILGIVIIGVRVLTGKKLDPESEQITELYNYFNIDSLSACNSLKNYTNKKIDYENLSTEIKLCLAYQKANLNDVEVETINGNKKDELCNYDDMIFRKDEKSNNCTVKIFDKKIIDDSYKKIFGKNIENNESFNADDLHICYLKNDKYYCGLSETIKYTIGNDSYIYRSIKKAVEKSSKIVIYDYFIKINNNECYSDVNGTLNEKCTQAYDKDTKIDIRFLKKYGTKYKHTYMKNADGTYSWISSEPI